MSWGTCYSGSNNIHFDYPPLMSDSRNFTNWNSACKKNDSLMENNSIKTNYQYRQYLIKNADTLMSNNQVGACNECGFCQYASPIQGSKAPLGKYLYKSCSDGTQPYGYQNSDLKNMYLSRQALESRLSTPILSQQELLYYPRNN